DRKTPQARLVAEPGQRFDDVQEALDLSFAREHPALVPAGELALETSQAAPKILSMSRGQRGQVVLQAVTEGARATLVLGAVRSHEPAAPEGGARQHALERLVLDDTEQEADAARAEA